jgi:nucleotide-binding universal stress UspA family protein
MYSKILIPLDGSQTAEQVLPYTRWLAAKLEIPIELLSAIDIAELAAHMSAEKAGYLDNMVEEGSRQSLQYLRGIATTFSSGGVNCSIERGRPEEVIIEKGEADPGTLIAMVTHGRSGMNRWLLGSVAEKVLRGTKNPLLLIRGNQNGRTTGEAAMKSIVVPLDGSELAASVLPTVAGLAKKLNLAVLLFRAYNLPATAYAGVDGYYVPDLDKLMPELREEARDYLGKKSAELKTLGVQEVVCEVKEGLSPDQIIRLARAIPDNLVAMCSHGRSGVKRWALGSVTETVVRHSGDPVLVLRAA